MDVEIAKQTGRAAFGELVALLKVHPFVLRVMLVEKANRLYRNLKGWVTVDELDLELPNALARVTVLGKVTKMLGCLKFDDEVLEWVREALHASHADERREHREAIRRHQVEYKRLDERIHAKYVDKLDGLIAAAFFERMSNQCARSRIAAGAKANGCKWLIVLK